MGIFNQHAILIQDVLRDFDSRRVVLCWLHPGAGIASQRISSVPFPLVLVFERERERDFTA